MPPPAPTKSSYQEKTLELIRSSNLTGLSAAVPGGMKVGTISGTPDSLLGAVDRRDPKTILLNDQLVGIAGGIKHTLPHEWEHVLQNQVSKRYGTEYEDQVLAEYKNLGGRTSQIQAALQKSGTSTKLRSHLETLLGTPVADYIGGVKPGSINVREQFAELSSIEQATKKDLTKDPVVRAEFFGNDQAMIDTYKATTGYRTTRTDARDLPPMTASPGQSPESSVLDKILATIKGAMQ